MSYKGWPKPHNPTNKNHGIPTNRQLFFKPRRTHKKLFAFFKTYQHSYIVIVEGNRIDHPDLLVEKRAKMKILLIDPTKDLPINKINNILKSVLALYKHV